MDAKTYATAVALIMVGVGVGYVLMGPFPETTEAQEDGGGYSPPYSSSIYLDHYEVWYTSVTDGGGETDDCDDDTNDEDYCPDGDDKDGVTTEFDFKGYVNKTGNQVSIEPQSAARSTRTEASYDYHLIIYGSDGLIWEDNFVLGFQDNENATTGGLHNIVINLPFEPVMFTFSDRNGTTLTRVF